MISQGAPTPECLLLLFCQNVALKLHENERIFANRAQASLGPLGPAAFMIVDIVLKFCLPHEILFFVKFFEIK